MGLVPAELVPMYVMSEVEPTLPRVKLDILVGVENRPNLQFPSVCALAKFVADATTPLVTVAGWIVTPPEVLITVP
jgi:hypothetical protein